ncbi:hypothetical protein [Streptomyces mexicanus]|uniref:hypothetical protein n=1 Tax=Streptomyces mexicanus TaxID=178566 RepID=UPI0036A03031
MPAAGGEAAVRARGTGRALTHPFNGGYAAVRSLGHRIGVSPVPGTDITGIDFPALAAALGCPADHTADPAELPAALGRVLDVGDEDGPRLLHLRVAAGACALYPDPWAG